MPANPGQRPRRFNVKLITPNAPSIVAMVHNNVTLNHRRQQDATLGMPAIVSRATMIVNQSRIMPIRTEES
jgi:hypothetical protein